MSNYELLDYNRFVLIKEKTMEDLQNGDVLVNDGYTHDRIVQGTVGKIVFTVDSDDETSGYDSVSELKRAGWELKSETQATEKTVSEIEKDLGMESGSLRIKKED